jgi:hypothetical protein
MHFLFLYQNGFPLSSDGEIIAQLTTLSHDPTSHAHDPNVKKLHSLNGANFFLLREALERVEGSMSA